ncbi:MAG: hypothetical protein E7537_05650 [Ruminococcaceae bacterium]|nr:hypothetical protein [Oscillospiraceae bacterium]
MNKKTIVIVSLTLVLALLAVAVIATFPTYLFEDTEPNGSSSIQAGTVEPNNGGQGDDVGILPDDEDNGGAQAVLPSEDPDEDEPSSSENSVEKLETLAKAKNVKVLGEYGSFEEGTKVKINKLGALNKAYYRSRHYLKGIADDFAAYNLSAKKDGKSVAPRSTLKITFTIPKDFDSKNVAVYCLLDKGVQEIDCTISKDGKTATVKVNQLGVYILVEKKTQNDEDDNTSSTTTESEKTESSSSNPTTSSDTDSSDSSNTSSDNSSGDTSSDNTSSGEDTNSDPNKESMDGWTPWR